MARPLLTEAVLLYVVSGRSLLYEVQNHVWPNFATLMLYAKNHSKFHNFFYRAIKPLELYFMNF
jgi:hypothetical protein